ncbi:hypothetical protein ACTXT7_008191 [Hymenolepis weldensis]
MHEAYNLMALNSSWILKKVLKARPRHRKLDTIRNSFRNKHSPFSEHEYFLIKLYTARLVPVHHPRPKVHKSSKKDGFYDEIVTAVEIVCILQGLREIDTPSMQSANLLKRRSTNGGRDGGDRKTDVNSMPSTGYLEDKISHKAMNNTFSEADEEAIRRLIQEEFLDIYAIP